MLKKMPIPICGVILGLYGLGNLLQSYSEGVRMACGVVATILLILFIISVIADFGKFKTRFVAAHTARNPQTGESVSVPDKTVVVFKPFANITFYSQKM